MRQPPCIARRRHVPACAAFVFALLLAFDVHAADAEPVSNEPSQGPAALAPLPTPAFRWKAEWPRFRTSEYVTTAIVGLAAGGLYAFGEPTNTKPVIGPILFDKAVREGVRVESVDALEDVRLVGDILTVVPMINVVLVESLIVPLARRSPDVAWQMTMINAQSFAFSGLVTWTLFEVVRRARPSYRECHAGTSNDPLCRSGETAGFPSGHTASAFTAAGLTCAHQANLALYGSGPGGGIACVASLSVASASAVLRVIGDRHYATDLLAGAGLGLLMGYGLPMLLHYRVPKWDAPRSSSAAPPARIGFTFGAGATPLGASAFGIF